MDPELAHLRRTRTEKAARAVLPASALAWTAAEVMHLTGVHCALPLGGATALAVAVAWGKAGRDENFPQSLPWWIAVTGAWLAAADAIGPLAWWPAPVLTFAWLAIALAASRAAHRHEAVTSAREWRAARAGWLEKRHRWGLGGSHLLDYSETWSDDGATLLSEWYLVSTKGTRKRASQLAGPVLAELIAESEDLPPVRVQVKRGHLAGRLEITVTRAANPFADPELHPLAGGDAAALPVPWRVTDGPAKVGASLHVPLWGGTGGKNVNVVSIKGWGKTVVLNNLSERATAAVDAVQVRINLSIKGHAEAERWGPSCLMTAFGPQQQARAVLVLRALGRIIEWRSTRYTTTFYEPSPADPLIVVIIDESDSVMEVGAAKKLVENLATKGREYGVTMVRAGQRGTVDYGSGKQKSQDDVFVTGAVNRSGEVRHAAGNAAWSIPDMAAFSEGHPGVWAVDELGGARQRDRAWLLERADSARLAAERAMTQPELHPDCVAFLGEPFRELLGTEVFTRWAHAQQDDDSPEGPGFVRVDARALAQAGRGAREQPAPAGAPEPESAAAEEQDPLRRWETEMDSNERGRLDAIAAKLGDARRTLAETSAMPRPQVSPEDREAAADEAWRQVGEAAQIPEEARPVLMRLLTEGTTNRAAAEALGVSPWTARTYLERLRNEGAAYVDGVKKAARWKLAPPPAEDDAPLRLAERRSSRARSRA